MNAMQKTIEYVLLIHYKLYDKNPGRLNKTWHGLKVLLLTTLKTLASS